MKEELEGGSGKAREARRKRRKWYHGAKEKGSLSNTSQSVKYAQGIKVRTEKHLLGVAIGRCKVNLAMIQEVTKVRKRMRKWI